MTEIDFGPHDADALLSHFSNTTPQVSSLPPAVHKYVPVTLAEALANVQARIPDVSKGEQVLNKDGSKRYTYADLSAVTRAILPLLGQAGLSWITKPTMRDGVFLLEYKLLHASGECEEGVYPLPQTGGPQDIGSAITYARRYALCSVTGVAPGDDDDAAEAQAAHKRGQQPVAPKVMSNFEKLTGAGLLAIPTHEQRQNATRELLWGSFVQAIDFKACLDESDAWGVEIKPGYTWRDAFFARLVAEIEAIDNEAEGKDVWAQLKAIGALPQEHEGKAIGVYLKERGEAIKARNEKAHETIADQVMTAKTVEDLDGPVSESIASATRLLRITAEQAAGLTTLMHERRNKLVRQQNVTAANDD